MTNRLKATLLSTALMIFTLFSTSLYANTALKVVDGYVREMPPGQTNTAAFMRLQNSSSKPVEISGAESPMAASVELHRHSHANGMMRMESVPSISVPAGGEFVFKSGDYHVMIMGVKQALKAGEKFPLVFITTTGDRIELSLPVQSIVAPDASKHSH